MSQVWQLYESATLTVDTQASYGTVTGQVSGGLLTFPGVGTFARPVTAGGLGYAFPYDDVTPDGGVNQAGPVSSGSPAVLTVTVGPVH